MLRITPRTRGYGLVRVPGSDQTTERDAAIAGTGLFTPLLLMRIQTFRVGPDFARRLVKFTTGKPDRLYRAGDFAR
ncbi:MULTISPECIES: hypothetical protein [Saccharothrix]|uniref:hypothetical protein n=1 Tax=Saccharothrix TaxID=2071 RepID=UPI0011613A1B|nr:hypothetical protein [Saccharothrix sp. CB00851]